MKLILPSLLIALTVSACAAGPSSGPVASATDAAPVAQASAAPAPPPASTPAPAAAPVTASTADLAAGQKAFEQGCFACHDQATILAQGGRTRAQWQEVVIMMQDRGYSGSAEEIRLVIDYLAATHPPKL